ncbi:hypothetical protein [Methylomonas sp. MK1]|uniref:hypothetical protein n=1 Tax=Methylomonas sp. MK1 TaxID=1131552 RepID=UPI000360F095|nr:hypothetical protein [Methylomonas sp. MK1]
MTIRIRPPNKQILWEIEDTLFSHEYHPNPPPATGAYDPKIKQKLDKAAAERAWLMNNLFSIDWQRVNARPTGTIEGLTAQSIGMVPEFADVQFIEFEALPYFEARDDCEIILKLKTFLRRLVDAKENIFPLGELKSIDGLGCQNARFNKANFVALASRFGWETPKEFNQAEATPDNAATQTKLGLTPHQILKPLQRSTNESLVLIYKFLEKHGIKSGDTVNITAKEAWGLIFSAKFNSDLIAKMSGNRGTAKITMNDGEEVDESTFVKKYNSRLTPK